MTDNNIFPFCIAILPRPHHSPKRTEHNHFIRILLYNYWHNNHTTSTNQEIGSCYYRCWSQEHVACS